MPFDQGIIDQRITELTSTSLTVGSPSMDLDEQYRKMLEYLAIYWDIADNIESNVLKYMEDNAIQFWSPFPYETPAAYQYFMFYLQLPPSYRSTVNVGRLLYSLNHNSEIKAENSTSINKQNKLFWEIRADLYEKSMLTELTFALQDTQKQRIAAMRNRSLTIASLTSDIAIEMLMKAVMGIRELDYKDLSPNQLINIVATASKIGKESNQLAEQALLLSDLIEVVNELESLEEEELRFIEAEEVS